MALTDMQFQMETAKSKMFDKAQAERTKNEEAAEMHQLNEQIRAEAKQSELQELFSAVQAPEQRRIRLEAARLFYGNRGSIYGNQKQIQLDEITLELARYSITGNV